MSLTSDVLEGLAARLNTAGVAVYPPVGAEYLTTDTAVSFSWLPPAPDRVISLSRYLVSSDPMNTSTQLGVQFFYRGLPGVTLDADVLADSVVALFNGARHLTFGQFRLTQMRWNSSLSHGEDDSERSLRSDNFYLLGDVPASVYLTE